MNVHLYVAESLCCAPGTNNIVNQLNSNKIKMKKQAKLSNILFRDLYIGGEEIL